MKLILSTDAAISHLHRCTDFSFAACIALVEYLKELEKDLGEEIELDAIALRCDWKEYSDISEAADDLGYSKRHLRNNTIVIDFDGGVLVQDF